ncbi:MAG: hypothetical protein JWR37_1495 [Mycobacterium sp.]|jgi:hypothetical protein|nr:hypothetical protein [Mycobacterium sp.]
MTAAGPGVSFGVSTSGDGSAIQVYVGGMIASPETEPRALRIFVADTSGTQWTEVTSGAEPTVRVVAPDLQEAQRRRARIRSGREAVSVILDVTVLVAGDFRSARRWMSAIAVDSSATLQYAGTLDGLAGLIADIFVADVADGVTLIPASDQQDVRALAEAALARVAGRLPVARAA